MTWKTVALVALVVLLVLIGIPLLMPGMGGGMCAECEPAVTPGHFCLMLAVLGFLAMGLSLLAVRVRTIAILVGALIRSLDIDRPPQVA